VLASGATNDLVLLAERLGAAVFTGFRRCDAYPNDHVLYGGTVPWLPPALLAPLINAEVILAIGTRMGEFNSLGYQLGQSNQKIIQIDVSAESMSVTPSPDISIIADAGEAIRAIRRALPNSRVSLARARHASAIAAHSMYLQASTPRIAASADDLVDMPAAICALHEAIPDGGITVSDAGSFAGYLHRYFRWSHPRTFFGTTSGAMGYGVPAAVGIKLVTPARPVVAVVGDGGFAMTMSEVRTAVRLGLRSLVFVIFDNGVYGTIRLHQDRRYPDRSIAVDLGVADLASVARSLGAEARTVTSHIALGDVLRDALGASTPVVIHALTDARQIDAWVDYA